LNTEIKRKGLERWQRADTPPPMRPTARDVEVVQAVWQLRMCTANQICDLLFSAGGRSRCQRRLTLLYQHRFIEKLPGRAPSSPDVYSVGREAVQGLRLLRAASASRDLLRRTRRVGQLEHVLAVNDVRCRIARAARERGLELPEWRDQGELARFGREFGVIPDAYFVLQREIEGRVGSAAFALEVERSPRGPEAMSRKYRRVVDFYRTGAYERAFHRRSLRVLVVVSSITLDAELSWAWRLAVLAERAGLSFGAFGSSRELLATLPESLFRAPIWFRPHQAERCAIGEIDETR
jgi:hypothetical protein